MVNSISSGNNSAYTRFQSMTAGGHQGRRAEKTAGQTARSAAEEAMGNAFANDFCSALSGRQEALSDQAASQDIDMSRTTRSRMMDWVNSEIQNGNMSLDEGFPFMAMAMKIPADGNAALGLHQPEGSEIINVPEWISKGIEQAERSGDRQTLAMLRSAQDTLQGASTLGLTARQGQQIAETAPPSSKTALSFEDIAKKYDVTHMTPVEVDQMVKEMTDHHAAPLKDLMMLSTYGAEFRAHLQESARAAGLGDVSMVTTAYDSGMDEKKDIIAIVRAQKESTGHQGGSTEGYDRMIALLEDMANIYQQFS